MSLNGNTLGSAVKTAIDAMSAAQKANLEYAWQTIAGVIVSHIQTYLDALEVNYDNTTSELLATDAQNAIDELNALLEATGGIVSSYDTGWINRSNWLNVHMGSNTTKNVDSDVAHNLNANLSNLIVKIMISDDGTDANSFEIPYTNYYTDGVAGSPTAKSVGLCVFQVDNNTVRIQTGANGVWYCRDTDGVAYGFGDWYYKIKVYRLL